MSITWNDFIKNPSSKKIYLARMRPGEEISGFSLHSGSIYKKTYSNEVAAFCSDMFYLSLAASLAAMVAGDFFYDTNDNTLYVWLSDSSDPANHTNIAFFYLYFATVQGDYDNGAHDWKERLKSIPDYEMQGGFAVSFGNIVFINNGYWKQIWDQYIFFNTLVEIFVTGSIPDPLGTGKRDVLPWSEVKTLAKVIITEQEYTDKLVTFEISDFKDFFDIELPINEYWTSNYANLDPSAEGTPIPIAYGVIKKGKATLIDSTTDKYKIHDGAVDSIASVYDDTGSIGFTGDAANGEFTLTAGPAAGEVYADFTRNVSGGSKAADIIKDILQTYSGLTDNDIKLSSFQQLNTDRPQALSIWLGSRVSISTVLEKINDSVFARQATNRDGKLEVYARKSPDDQESGIKEYDNYLQILKESFSCKKIFQYFVWKVKMGYDPDYSQDEATRLIYESKSDAAAKYRYRINRDLTIPGYLKNKTDAAAIADLYLAELKKPIIEISFSTKLKPLDNKVGDTIKVDRVTDHNKGPVMDSYYFRTEKLKENSTEKKITITAVQ